MAAGYAEDNFIPPYKSVHQSCCTRPPPEVSFCLLQTGVEQGRLAMRKKCGGKRRFSSTSRSAAACVVHHASTYCQPMQWRIVAPANDVSAPKKCASHSARKLRQKKSMSITDHFLQTAATDLCIAAVVSLLGRKDGSD